MIDHIKQIISASITAKQHILADEGMLATTQEVVQVIVNAFKTGHRVYFAGNGGSAADAQHLASRIFLGGFIRTGWLCRQKHCIATLPISRPLPMTTVMMKYMPALSEVLLIREMCS